MLNNKLYYPRKGTTVEQESFIKKMESKGWTLTGGGGFVSSGKYKGCWDVDFALGDKTVWIDVSPDGKIEKVEKDWDKNLG